MENASQFLIYTPHQISWQIVITKAFFEFTELETKCSVISRYFNCTPSKGAGMLADTLELQDVFLNFQTFLLVL